MKIQDITSPEGISLDRDGLIEASAGTGKTYTLTRLVLLLIIKKNIDIDRILVVTYTEKAAGEMKERLRLLLEEAAESDSILGIETTPEIKQRLRAQSLNYDRAAIQTIHSFCLNTLQRYAFENSFHFQLEQVDDTEPAFEAVRFLLNEQLPDEFGNSLESLLALSGFKRGDKHANDWEKNIIALCLKANPDFSKMEPEADWDLQKALKKLENSLRELGETVNIAGLSTKIAKNAIKQIPRYKNLGALLKSNAPLPLIHNTVDLTTTFSSPTKASNPSVEELHCVENLNRLTGEFAKLGAAFKSRLILQAGIKLQELKLSRKQISFNDMLTRVEEGLRPKNSLLKKALQRQFKAALVDEFQDTDPVQWNIFRTIFLKSPDHRLFIIGDPKQAIYSFRGADIHTYYSAAEELTGRIQTETAAHYRLPTNWRSAAGAIEEANLFFKKYFAETGEAESRDGRTGFHPAEIPDTPRNSTSGSSGISRIAFPKNLNADTLRKETAGRIAEECLTLLSSGIKIQLEGETERLILPKDICILIRKRKYAALYEKELLRRGLPCTIYKKEGIYSSIEARHLSLVLSYLADPRDNDHARLALLTRFFQYGSKISPSVPDINSAAGKFLKKLQKLAAGRRWGELFRILIHESGTALRLYPEPEGPRQLTNLEHITQNLETAAINGGYDIHRLDEHLKRLINNEGDNGREEGLHRIESEEPRIQIMTVHSSKGLEFPFVFLTSLIEGTFPSEAWYTRTENGIKIYDLLKSEKNKAPHQRAIEEENKRLLYVALTRGIFHTTLFYQEENPEKPEKNTDKRNLLTAIRLLPESDTPAPDKEKKFIRETGGNEIPPPEPLFTDPQGLLLIDGYSRRRISLASFSSLADHVEGDISYGETAPEPDETETARPEADGTILIPRGPRTGNLLHSLLETTDFAAAAVGPDEFTESNLQRIAAAMKAARVKPIAGWFREKTDTQPSQETMEKTAAREICRILHNALNCPLTGKDGTTFRLCDIGEKDRIQEMEFHFKLPEKEEKLLSEESEWFSRGFLTGFIDLVFRHKGLYYILDWKSNWLPGYTQEHLENGMKGHNYKLQASIYTEALRRWLGTRNIPDRENIFGGVFYLFLRGVNNSGEGIYTIHNPKSFPSRKGDVQ